jgi:hypothetical protein
MAAKRKKKRSSMLASKRMKNIDQVAKHNLDLFIESTSELYPQKEAIISSLQKKKARGKYDKTKAPKVWQYWVDRGAKQYSKEFSGSENLFNKDTRTALAEDLAKRYENGED